MSMPRRRGFTLGGRLRIGARIALLLVTLAVSLPAHFACRLFTRRSPMPRVFLGMVARIVGARVRIVGIPLRREAFIVSNHVSWLDIPALAGATGTAFVAKAEAARVPIIGWLCRLNHTVFVDRGARLAVASQIAAVRDALMQNHAVTVFPEGTTGDGCSLLPFKSAILSVLDPPPPGVMVQPVLLDYGPAASSLAWLGDEHGLDNALAVLARPGTFPLTIRFLEPFSPAALPGRKAIAAEAQARIAAALASALTAR